MDTSTATQTAAAALLEDQARVKRSRDDSPEQQQQQQQRKLCSDDTGRDEREGDNDRARKHVRTGDDDASTVCSHQHESATEQAATAADMAPTTTEASDATEEVCALAASATEGHSSSTALLRVAIIVPFRDTHAAQKRQAHLDKFVPHMTALLQKQALSSFHIFIIEQSCDERKFNRGKLLNAGFDMARNEYDVFIFHDVDLLPGDDLGPYYAQKPELGPLHIARVWDRYNGNPKYFGGVVVFTRQQFLKINGFPNNFWGWGGEDDELYCRVLKKKLVIQSPPSGTITDLEAMGLEEKLETLRKTKWKCTVKRELLKEHSRTWKKNGITSLHYELVGAVALSDWCTKITVHLGANNHWSDARSSLERTDVQPVEDPESCSLEQPQQQQQEEEEMDAVKQTPGDAQSTTKVQPFTE